MYLYPLFQDLKNTGNDLSKTKISKYSIIKLALWQEMELLMLPSFKNALSFQKSNDQNLS